MNAAHLPLEDDRVRLRALRPDDAPAFAAGAQDPAVRQHGHLPEPGYTPESVTVMIEQQATSGLDRGDLAVLAIATVGTDEFAGSLVLFDIDEDTAEVGFWVHPDHRGGQVARHALDLAATFAREFAACPGSPPAPRPAIPRHSASCRARDS